METRNHNRVEYFIVHGQRTVSKALEVKWAENQLFYYSVNNSRKKKKSLGAFFSGEMQR